ncbi:MAG: hypothetical protein AVDCRST_MAG88-855, partial [uncultured Thermomicrobiales bacterium]
CGSGSAWSKASLSATTNGDSRWATTGRWRRRWLRRSGGPRRRRRGCKNWKASCAGRGAN